MESSPPKSFPKSKLSADVEPFVPKNFQAYLPIEEPEPIVSQSIYYPVPVHYQDMPPNYYSSYPPCLMPYHMYPPHCDPYQQMPLGIDEKAFQPPSWQVKRGYQKHKPRRDGALRPQNSRKSDQPQTAANKNSQQKKNKEILKSPPHSTNKQKNNENIKSKESTPPPFPSSSIKATSEAFLKEEGHPPKTCKQKHPKQAYTKILKVEEDSTPQKETKESGVVPTKSNCDNVKVLLKEDSKLERNSKRPDLSQPCTNLGSGASLDYKRSRIKPKHKKLSKVSQSDTSLSSDIHEITSNMNKMNLNYPPLNSSKDKLAEEKAEIKAIVWPAIRSSKPKLEIPKSIVTKNSGNFVDRNRPLQINLAELLKVKSSKKKKEPRVIAIKSGLNKGPANFLDSTATIKRGKEREKPKPKRPSAIKKIILLEKEFKKKCREDLKNDSHSTEPVAAAEPEIPEIDLKESPLIVETPKIEENPASCELTNTECAKQILHTRKFRDYCTNLISPELNQTVFDLLGQLVKYQDNMFQRDPMKARMRRRVVCGLREIKKHVKLRKLKAIIIAADVEKIDSKGGLTDTLKQIEVLAQEKGVETIYALQRSALGKACFKKVPSSCVGIFNYDGANVLYKKMLSQVKLKSKEYDYSIEYLETLITQDMWEHIENRNNNFQYYQWLDKTRTTLIPQVKEYIDNQHFEEEND